MIADKNQNDLIMKTGWFKHIRPGNITICATALVLTLTAAATLSFRNEDGKYKSWDNIKALTARDSLVSVNSFMQVYKVLMSPRCMNCHPSGDIPLNGDDHHLHPQGVKRGIDGKGVYALKCTNCHQKQNTPGLNMPPGTTEEWHLPPADMKMVFQGKTPQELAEQMKDPKRNGGKSPHDLLEHVKTDLVKWGWNPGEGRTTPPLSYAEFVKQWNQWISSGAVAPAAGEKLARK
jgi:hypothetical protein